MKVEISMKRVLRLLEQKLSTEPTKEALEAYTALLQRLADPETKPADATVPPARLDALVAQVTELDKRVAFLEAVTKVRKIG